MKKGDCYKIVVALIVISLGLLLSYLIKNNNKIVLITYQNKVKNNNYVNDSYHGLKKLKDVSSVKKIECLDERLFVNKVNNTISKGTDLIWSVEGSSKNIVYKLAEENKEVTFCVLDTNYNKKLNNLCAVNFDVSSSSFMAGYTAALMSNNNKIGFIGGRDEKTINNYEKYYVMGAKYANNTVEILSDYSGTYDDKIMGENLAQAQYDNGVDIIFTIAGTTSDGVINKSKMLGKWIMGVDETYNNTAPDNLLLTVKKDTGKVINKITLDYLNKKNIGKTNYNYGLEDGIVDIELTSNVDIETKNKIAKVRQQFLKGDLIIKDNKLLDKNQKTLVILY